MTALALWRQIWQVEPMALGTNRAMCTLLAEVEGTAAALQHLQAICARFPHNFQLHRLWTEWMREEEPQASESVARRLIAIHPADPWSRRELALCLARQGRLDEALDEAQRAIDLDPNDPYGYSTRGDLRQQAGRLPEAKADFRRALSLSVDVAFAIRALLRACETLDERRKALKVVEAELSRQVVFGDGVLTYRQEARLYLDAEAVLASMRVGLRERPDLWQTWSATISQLAEMGRLDEALGLAREATARFPLLPKAWLDVAYVQRMRLDVAGERDALEHARTKTEEHARIQCHETPQPVGVAAEIADRCAPVGADLLLDGEVP